AGGQHLTRFEQLAGGLPVYAGELVVVTDAAGNVLSAGGETARSVHPATVQVNAAAAAATAVRVTARTRRPGSGRLNAGPPELVAYDPSLLGAPGRPGAGPVWRVEVAGAGVRELVLVDATRGLVALHFNEAAGATNRMVCDFHNASFDDTAVPPGYTCDSAHLSRGEGAPPTLIGDVDPAYDNAGATADWYQARLGVDLTALIGTNNDGAGKALRLSTRVCLNSVPPCPTGGMANAFWDGAQAVFGRDYARSEDVVAHELTHGLTEQTSGLAYVYQSGAINESMSDVFGEMVDQTDGVSGADSFDAWLVGENLPGGAIRSMSNPPAFGDPDTMTSPNYTADIAFTDNGGVHTNSGVGNKAAFLIAHGGAFDGFTVAGLGVPKTAAIYYRTENLLSTGADYADLAATLPAACRQVAAVANPAGVVAEDCTDVQSAVNAVQMSAQPTTAGAAAPEAPFCNSGKTQRTLFADDMEGRVNWTGSLSNWDYTDGYATSGRRSLVGYTPDNAAAGVYGGSMQAIPLYVTAGPTTYIRFSHYDVFDTDAGVHYDGGQVEYSLTAGASWLDAGALPADNGYNSTVTPNSPSPAGSFRGFGGYGAGYYSTRINVSSLGGHSVLFRFRITGDELSSSTWQIDDFSLYQCGYPTVITAVRSAPAAIFGYPVTVSGTLHYAVGGAAVPPVTIWLAYRRTGTTSWFVQTHTTSTASGTYSFAVKPGYNTDYQTRFYGSASFLGATSGTVSISSVPAIAVSVSPATVPHNTYARIPVSVSPNHAGQQVTLQRLVGTTWTWVAYGNLNPASSVTFSVRPASAGTYTYRIYKIADYDHLVGTSPSVTLHAT
ncbi:MAG: M4 family metallopeptidase, partial [Actinomycetota bacterium]|nr:M4 family metallopeptidase [Actinomycetota bacterium]